jgi:hypothetical protein
MQQNGCVGGIPVVNALVALPSTPEVTRLLRAWSAGDQQALERLAPLIHDELQRTVTWSASTARIGKSIERSFGGGASRSMHRRRAVESPCMAVAELPARNLEMRGRVRFALA